MKKTLTMIGIVLVLVLLAGLGYGYYNKLTSEVKNPIVTMEIEGYGTIKLELYPDKAPNTVANFVKLINEGHYDGLIFHRTIPEFMIQGGDISGDGSGSLEYTIPGEFIANRFSKNDIKHERGVISMARGDYSSLSSSLTEEGYNSANAQFFIMHKDSNQLNGYYAAFGRVIEGMDIVDKIATTEVIYRTEQLAADEEAPKDEEGNEISSDRPVNPPVITSVTVDTFGVNYGDPKTLEPFDYNSWIMQQYGF